MRETFKAMQYRPKFCCECGAKVDRVEWQPWTSRRFCEVCEKKFQLIEWKSSGVLVAGLILSLIGFAFFLKSASPNETVKIKNLSTQNDRLASKESLSGNTNSPSADVLKKLPVSDEKELVKPVESPSTIVKNEKNATIPIASETEKLYFCGAQTKKGTPCSRRVKGGGRCWQHQGMPAMLSEKELAINR